MEQVIGLLKNNVSETETVGISMVLFLVAFLYLLCAKNKERRGWLVFIALLFVLVLNPFFYSDAYNYRCICFYRVDCGNKREMVKVFDAIIMHFFDSVQRKIFF